MMTRSSLLARAIWAVTAFSTVWCLGCSAFEPMMLALTKGGATSEMDCARGPGNADAAAVTAAESNGVSVLVAVSAATRDGGNGGFTCDCALCHGASLVELAIVGIDRGAPLVTLFAHAAPPSVDYTPLVPPPQFLI